MPPPAIVSPSLESLVRLVGSAAAMAEIAPGLTVDGPSRRPVPGSAVASDGAPGVDLTWLAREGLSSLAKVARPEVCSELVQAVEALAARELPASFAYAFDEIWDIGEHIRERISAASGHDYRLVEDLWAWRIVPGHGRGWRAHRGVGHELLDRSAPEVINVWVALSDVTAERACMHAVPLDDDPGYPDALDRVEASLESVRAMPAVAGDALFWNANVLHWGGRCSARAVGPRISCSFTLCRADSAARFSELVLLAPGARLDLASRMDAVARMILLYGTPEREDVPLVVREWAAFTHGLASRFARRP